MILLNRMVLSIFVKFTGLALASFSGIYLLIEFFEKVDDFLEHSAALNLYVVYFLNKIPIIVTQLMPLAILMGAFMTVASLSRHGELTAMFSSGISLFGVTRPILSMALLISLATLTFNEVLLPIHVQKTNHVFRQQVQGKTDLTLKLGQVWFKEENAIVNIRLANPREKSLYGVFVFKMNEHFQIISNLEADSAIFSDGRWVGNKVQIRRFDPETSDLLSVKVLRNQDLGFRKNPEEFQNVKIQREEMNFQKLWQLSRKLKQEGYDATGYEVDMHTRLSAPFACIIMAFLGVPFALRGSRRTGLAMGVAVSVSIGIAYYFINAILIAFGYSSVLPPVVAAWAANILFFLLGLYLLLSLEK
jgi:lipopolysaccharide export system permease protein